MGASRFLAAVAAGFITISAASAEEGAASRKGARAETMATPAVTAAATQPVDQGAPASDARAASAEKPASASLQVAAPRTSLGPTLLVKINLSSQSMSLHYGGQLQETWTISSGREGYLTPRGVFRPQWAAKMWYSRKYDNAPMPNAVFFVGGVAVHGTQSTGLLGMPASHGCVRLAPGNAARFYALVHKHGYGRTRIEVFGVTPATRMAKHRRPSGTSQAAAVARRGAQARIASSGGGWGLFDWAAPQPPAQVRARPNGVIYLSPKSAYRGRETFVHNGVVYRRVR